MGTQEQNQKSLVGQKYQFKQENYRIIIVLLFSLASVINGMCWVVTTPIAQPIENAYNVSAALVAFIPMSYLIFYVIINFPSNWVIDVKGIKKGVVIGACLTCIGCLIRCLVKVNFTFVIVGQIFCAIAQPFLTNAPMKIATRWFMPKNRSLAMAILTVVNIIGTGIGFVIPSMFVTEHQSNELIKGQFFWLLLVEAILSTLSLVLIILFFKESPSTLPSHSSMVPNTDFKKSIKIIFKDIRFLSLAFCFGTVNGTFNIYGSLMDHLLSCYGFNQNQVSTFGGILIGTGILAAGLFGFYVEKTLKYRNAFWACAGVGLLNTAGFPLALKFLSNPNQYYWVYIILIIGQGFVFIPLLPLIIDYGSDIMFPIGQAQIAGFLMSVGQIFGIFFIQISQLAFGLGKNNGNEKQQTASFNSVIFCNSFLVVGCVLLMFQNRELKRSNHERQKLEKEQEIAIKPYNTIFTEQNPTVKQSVNFLA